MVAIVFLNSGVKNGSIDALIQAKIHPKHLDPTKPLRDSERDKDFEDEIDEERMDKEYYPCHDDIFDLFTIGKK